MTTPQDTGTEAQKRKSNRKSALIGAIFLLVVLVSNFVYIFASGQFEQFAHALSDIHYGWLFAGMAVMLGYLVFGSLAYVIVAWIDPASSAGFRDMVSVEATGTFFGNLTPSQMGATPMQIFRLTRTGMDVGAATAVQIIRFSMYEAGEVAIAGVLMALRFGYFLGKYGAVVWINLVIFAAKCLHLAGIILISLFPHFITRVAVRVIDFAGARGWVKNPEKYDAWVTAQITQFADAFRRGMKDWRPMVAMFVVSVLQLSCLYIVPWFIAHAFGVSSGFIDMWCIGSMVQLVSNAIPLPGGTGGVEASFAVFMGPILGSAATAGYLVWRLVTFYGYTVLAGLATLLRSRDQGPTLHDRIKAAAEKL